MGPRREFTYCLLAAATGSGLAVVAAGQAWFTAGDTQVSGQEVMPLAGAAGLAGLAAVAALVATRGLARRVVGLVIVVCAAAILVGSMAPDELGTDALPAGPAGTAIPAATPATMTAWPWLSAAGAVVLLAAGAYAVVRAGRWPAMSARYDRLRAAKRAPGEGTGADLWDAIDRGADPTATDEVEPGEAVDSSEAKEG